MTSEAHAHAAEEWSARRILSELCDAELRRRIVTTFWKRSEKQARELALLQLAKVMHFREQTLRAAPAEKKAEWLLSRAAAPEFAEALEMSLMLYHTEQKKELLAAFLDHWKIPHVHGTIESDDSHAPSREEVAGAARELEAQFSARDIAVYLASLGLLMGDDWREVTWPVVAEIRERLAS